MREALDVGEASLELRQDFEDTLGFVFRAWTFGDLFSGLVGSFGVSDGLGGKHLFQSFVERSSGEEVAEKRASSRNNRPHRLKPSTNSTRLTRPWKGRSFTVVHAFVVFL